MKIMKEKFWNTRGGKESVATKREEAGRVRNGEGR